MSHHYSDTVPVVRETRVFYLFPNGFVVDVERVTPDSVNEDDVETFVVTADTDVMALPLAIQARLADDSLDDFTGDFKPESLDGDLAEMLSL